MIEPGRSLVGNAGVCVTEVLYLKPGEQKNFCIVDAAMNDLPRPGDVPGLPRDRAGACSRAGDRDDATTWSARSAKAATGSAATARWPCRPGDLLAVLSAGAYCMSMASNYNTRGRAAEVLVDGDAGPR